MRTRLFAVWSLLVFLSFNIFAKTEIVMLGTGTPVPEAGRAGSSVAVVYNDKAYVFDAGGGMVRNAIVAAQNKGIKALYPTRIQYLFLTHLHSDHIMDVSELASTYWWRRTERLKLFGPVGSQAMVNGYYQMLSEDIALRTQGSQPVKEASMYRLDVTEFESGGWTVKDGDVTVTAFSVSHGDIEPAFGYRIFTPDEVIVISGDTTYFEQMKEHAKGADILIHEVISEQGLSKLAPSWQQYLSTSHTRTSQLAELANSVKPQLLILTHVLHYDAPLESVLDEVQKGYSGKVILANDLDIYRGLMTSNRLPAPALIKSRSQPAVTR